MMRENRQRLRIVEDGSARFDRPTILVGVPEVGLVGTIACSYLKEQLELPEIGFVDSDLVPQVMVVHDSLPKHPVRIFGKGDLAILLSETPLTPRLSYELAGELVRWSSEKGAKLVAGVSGVQSRSRETDGETKPNVFAITNDNGMAGELKAAGVRMFEEGVMVGIYATLLSRCMISGMKSLTLLAESHQQFPDPGAAAAVIEVLAKLLSIKVDLKPLLAESEEIRVRSRELMSSTQAMQRGAPGAPGVYS